MADEQDKIEVPKAKDASSPIVVKLRKAVPADGDEVMELTFREPTAADIDRIGVPVLIDPFGDVPRYSFDSKLMTQMMSALAAVPPSTIKRMHTKDWINSAWLLLRFFTPDL